MPTGSQYLAQGRDPITGLAPATASGQASSSTYFPQQGMLPGYLQQLLGALGGNAQSAAGQYNNYISNPTASPLFQNTLNGLLQALAPSETAARRNYNDAGIEAGNRSSGLFAGGAANLEGNLLRNRQTTASQLLQQQFPQMTQALLAPQQLASQLMQALKLSQAYGAQPQHAAAAGGGSSDPFASFLDQYHAQNAGNPYDPFSNTGFQYGAQAQAPAAAAPTFANPSAPIGNGGGTLFMPNGDYVSSGTAQNPPWSPPGSSGAGNPIPQNQFSDFRQSNPNEFGFGSQNPALEY